MEVKSCRINFDFEDCLFKNTANYRVVNKVKRFEYIYFFFDTTLPLFAQNFYSAEYLKYLQEILQKEIKLKCEGPYENFWGDLSCLEQARRRNSKVVLAKWLLENNLNDIPLYLNEIKGISLDEGQYYYRPEFGFSGIRNRVVDHNQASTIDVPGVITPYLDIHTNYGITFYGNEYYICENIIDNGVFVGGRILGEETEYFTKKEIKEVIVYVKSFLNSDFGQFDSFTYQVDGKLYWNRISEVNFRKTMASFIRCLNTTFGPGKWKVEKSKNKEAIKDLVLRLNNQYGKVVLTSPENHSHLSYYILD